MLLGILQINLGSFNKWSLRKRVLWVAWYTVTLWSPFPYLLIVKLEDQSNYNGPIGDLALFLIFLVPAIGASSILKLDHLKTANKIIGIILWYFCGVVAIGIVGYGFGTLIGVVGGSI